ncbi:membrane protein FxsA [Mycobacterium sp. PS03-16]|nr:membrane protein FxsA [Mycobacterium sp. PS03-16]
MRLFLLYAVIEMAVVVALVSTIGLGWTLLLAVSVFVLGLALAGAQLKRQLHRLRTGLTATTAQGAVTDSALVALGTVLVVVPGLASSVLGALLLLPPTRAAARPVVTALAARRVGRGAPLFVAGASAMQPRGAYRGTYIDGEVVDVADDAGAPPAPNAVERRAD